MTNRSRRFQWPILFAAWVLWGTVLAADPPELRKPAPDVLRPTKETLADLVRIRYPQLLEQVTGTPVVTMLFDPDGSVMRSNLTILAQNSGTLTATAARFEGWDVRVGELQSLGEVPVQLPHARALVIFGIRSDGILNRELVEHYFPEALTSGVPDGQRLWVLFDHEGHVRRYGVEGMPSADLRKRMQHRYPGVDITEVTVEQVMDRGGHPVEDRKHATLKLNCLWLAANSPLTTK